MAGIYDVVADYAWTSVPKRAGLRAEAPSALVTAYELEESQLRAFVSGYVNVFNKSSDDPMKFYDGLYKTKSGNGSGAGPTRYRFPFFEDNFRGFSNNYADTFSQISQRGAQFLGTEFVNLGSNIVDEFVGLGATVQQVGNDTLATQYQNAAGKVEAVADKFIQDFGRPKGFQFKVPRANNPSEYPGTYVEHPMFYQYANTDAGIEISFVLANTIDRGDIDRNQELIKSIMTEARPERGSALEMTFPRIYEVKVPGLRYVRWAYLANAAFNLLGQRRQVGNKIVPEAYGISLVYNSLTIEVANFIERAGM
tara:strand:- start:4145 stop:5074 length:930 start_codon:yes stop_codon:yes gene_type:complete